FKLVLNTNIERCFNRKTAPANGCFPKFLLKLRAYHKHKVGCFNILVLVYLWSNTIENRNFNRRFVLFLTKVANFLHTLQYVVLSCNKCFVAVYIIWVVYRRVVRNGGKQGCFGR